jgi:hypothetical protein
VVVRSIEGNKVKSKRSVNKWADYFVLHDSHHLLVD